MSLRPLTSRSPLLEIFDSGEIGSAQATFDVQGIPALGVDLEFRLIARGDTAAATVTCGVTLNNDTGANYDNQQMFSNAATMAAAELFGGASLAPNASIVAASAGAGLFGYIAGVVFGYASATFNKVAELTYTTKTGTASGNLTFRKHACFWRSSSAVNRITFTPSAGNFAAGSRLRVFVVG